MHSVTTKTGDTGESGLADGRRLSKSDRIFEVLGTFDELNAQIGLCIALCRDSAGFDHIDFLLSIQELLFVAGGQIAGSTKVSLTQKNLTALEKYTHSLELTMQENWHTLFVLPGGCIHAAQIDVARAVCRRLERVLVFEYEQHPFDSIILRYCNRLSDFLYILRCCENARCQKEERFFHAKT